MGGASTLFGGCIDVITGEITQTQKMYIFDGTENWGDGSTYAPGHRFYSYTNNPQTMDMMYGQNRFDTIACNYLTPDANGTSASSSKQNIITVARTGRQFYVAVTFCDSIDEWKAYLSEHPLKVVANLENPLSYVISPHQLATLKNSNTFWSNADRIEITYEYINQFNAIESRNLILRNTPHVATASGNTANFGTDMGSELKECKINLLPRQEGTGDPSPTNVRTLNGWADLQVYQFGENAIGTVVEPQQLVENGLLWNKLSDGTVEYSGKVTGLSGIAIGYVDVTNMDQIYGKIIGDNGNVAFNTLTLYDNNFKQVGKFEYNNSLIWETHTRANTIASADISEFTTATKANIRIKRNINNINMRGRCLVIVGGSKEDVEYKQTTITFPAAGKNLFNLHVPEVDMYPRIGSATTKRLFTPNTIVNQTSGTNYFNTTYMPYSVNGNTLTINCKSGYGTGFAFRLKPLTTYTINADFDVDTGAGIGISYYSADGTFYKQVEGASLIYLPLSFTTRADTDIVLITFKAVSTELYNTDIHITNIQLEEGSAATEYEEYQYPIWGGYVDLVNNEWVEEYGMRVFKGETGEFTYYGDATWRGTDVYIFRSKVLDRIVTNYSDASYSDIALPVLSSTPTSANHQLLFYIGTPTNQLSIGINKSLCEANDESLNEFLSENPMTLVYQLATPIHHSLSMPNFSTLHGINNIWSNGNGGINLSYYKRGDNSYQYIPANTLATNNDYIIVTSDGYVIGDENDYITY